MAQPCTTLIQITDMHIFDDPSGELSGVNTRNSLAKVLSKINDDYSDAELMILTGDNTHESTDKACYALKDMLDEVPIPYTFLPGNHDHEKNFAALVNNYGNSPTDPQLDKWLNLGNWNILLLDSHVENEVNGHLSDEEIEFAREMLSYSTEPVIAFIHHHLLPVGCAWLDQQVVGNANQFFNTIHGSSIKAVFNGHVHQEWYGQHQGIHLYSTPSTCMQFKPNSDDYAEDDLAPGFRWIKLYPDETFETGLVRV